MMVDLKHRWFRWRKWAEKKQYEMGFHAYQKHSYVANLRHRGRPIVYESRWLSDHWNQCAFESRVAWNRWLAECAGRHVSCVYRRGGLNGSRVSWTCFSREKKMSLTSYTTVLVATSPMNLGIDERIVCAPSASYWLLEPGAELYCWGPFDYCWKKQRTASRTSLVCSGRTLLSVYVLAESVRSLFQL